MKTFNAIIVLVVLTSLFGHVKTVTAQDVPHPFLLAGYVGKPLSSLEPLCTHIAGFQSQGSRTERLVCAGFLHMDRLATGSPVVIEMRDGGRLIKTISILFPIGTKSQSAALTRAWIGMACPKVDTNAAAELNITNDAFVCPDRTIIMIANSNEHLVISFTKM